MTTTPKPLAYSYRRFSHIKQEQSHSLKRQLDIAVEYCQKNNLQLVEDKEYNFLDEAVSAYKGKNVDDKGELRRFYDLVEKKAIPTGSYLIVESLDRLSRQHPREALPRFMDLLNADINIVSVNDGRVYTKDFNQLDLIVSIMEMSRSYSESENKSIRVGKAWRDLQEAARDGRPMGATKPAWLDAIYAGGDKASPKEKPVRFEVNEAKADVVRMIFRMATAGSGRDVIARTLNEQGIPSFKGTTWGGSSVSQIIRSPTVIGLYQPYTGKGKAREPVGAPIPGLYKAIISEQEFYAANGAVTDRFRGKVTKQSGNINLWQKIAKCAVCGEAMHTASKGQDKSKDGGKNERRTYMQCREARKGKCTGKAVRLDKSELVFKQLLAKVNSLSLIQSNVHSIQADLHAVDARIAEQQATLQEHMKFLRERSSPSLRLLVAECEDEITTLEAQRVELQQALATDTIEDKDSFFAKLDLTSKEGRARANGLLRRLKILVYLDPLHHHYRVEQDGTVIFDVRDIPDSGIMFYPATAALRQTIERQDGTVTPRLSDDHITEDAPYESEGHDSREY